MRAVLITGPPGSGKTSVLTALADALSEDDVPHAAVEVEALAWTHPALDDDRRHAHVRAVCAGHDLVLVGDTVETEAELARLLDAVGADEWFVVRLEAPPDVLAERIVAREPPGWAGLEALVEHARAMPPVGGADLVLGTEGARAGDVAARIRAALPGRFGDTAPVAGLHRTIPALPVRDVPAAVAFYRERFGFDAPHASDGFAVLVRDDAVLHLWGSSDEAWRGRADLAERPVRSGAESFLAGTASCRIEVADVDALFAELQVAGVLHPVSTGGVGTTDFGTREFATLDIEGNLLTFFHWEDA